MRIEESTLDHPDAERLIKELQDEYVVRYGEGDGTPTEVSEFAAPDGIFLVGYLDGVAVASGGWRSRETDGEFQDGDIEVKRMYVVPEARGRGLSRLMLAELEARARAAGKRRAMVETGNKQPEAIGLYLSTGYVRIPNFGLYRCEPDSRCYAKSLEP